MKRSILIAGICSLFLFQLPAQAGDILNAPSQYFTNFDDRDPNYSVANWIQLPNGNYTSDGTTQVSSLSYASDLAHPNEWITTDQNVSNAFDNQLSGTNTSDLWAVIGGGVAGPGNAAAVPSAVSTELWTPVNLRNAIVQVNFAITSSSSTQDIFGWTVRNTAGDKLFAIIFTPLNATTYTISKENAAGVDTPVIMTTTAGTGPASLGVDAIYSLSITTDLLNHSYSATISSLDANSNPINDPLNFPNITFGDNTLGANATDIGAVAATYTLSDPQVDGSGTPTNAGDNLMEFNNYSIVPEPSTFALAIGGLGLLAAFQRRRSSIR